MKLQQLEYEYTGFYFLGHKSLLTGRGPAEVEDDDEEILDETDRYH